MGNRLVRWVTMLLVVAVAVSLVWLYVASGPVHLSWRLPPEPEFFPGVVRFPQGEQVGVSGSRLQAVWLRDKAYVLPLSALGRRGEPRVRYLARGVPTSFQVEWLNPWEGTWHPLDDLPPDLVQCLVEPDPQDPEKLQIDFGPPEGAEFEPGMFRGVWFRITPEEMGEFPFTLAGYSTDEEGRADPDQRVTPKLQARIQVK